MWYFIYVSNTYRTIYAFNNKHLYLKQVKEENKWTLCFQPFASYHALVHKILNLLTQRPELLAANLLKKCNLDMGLLYTVKQCLTEHRLVYFFIIIKLSGIMEQDMSKVLSFWPIYAICSESWSLLITAKDSSLMFPFFGYVNLIWLTYSVYECLKILLYCMTTYKQQTTPSLIYQFFNS